MSNGGEGNYDIYLQDLGRDAPVRLTDHKEKDGQTHWSPIADRLALVSGRTGKGDIYLLDLSTRLLTRLTRGGKVYFYPQWSPDGKELVMMHGSNENAGLHSHLQIFPTPHGSSPCPHCPGKPLTRIPSLAWSSAIERVK